ncbi:hypothetical protein PRIPAC_77905 [Pristionchus pacificus]|uniref:RNA helicase n=1 Tax=Pristionchus pacificus TaxID=54126 RepID=A0A2A6CL02_PRIPA|nr:hypothetical protein PRIPAC_77905 [Pristionchus pacificus]|eukprot:PDM78757.1 helicase [Pristionchus pacificus]
MERAISLLRYVGEFSLRGSGFDVKAVMPPPTVAKDEATAVRPLPSISYRPESKEHDSSTKEGVLFDKFFDLTVELSEGSGRNLTESEFAKVKNFEDVGFPSRLTANITSAGFTRPTLVQQYAMKCIKDGKDIIACSPTGSGKTAAYLLPILRRLLKGGVFCISNKSPCKPRALILVPTRELAIQIHQVIVRFTSGTYCKSEVLYEGSPFEHQKSVEMLKGVSILVGTAGRVMQFVDKGLVSLEQIKFLVLDEADKMLDPSFAEDLKCIMRKGRIPPRDKRQTATFPALAKERLKREKLLNDDHLMIVIDNIGAANKCRSSELTREERQAPGATTAFKQKTLIFVTCKKTADDLEWFLCRNGISAAVIHADREQARRESAFDDFRLGRIPFLIASAVAERGLDIAGVDHVINYDMPKELDDYVYRIGRTGRIGNAGHSTSFIDPAHDGHIIDPLVTLLTQAEQIVPDWLEQLRKSHREKSLQVDSIVDKLSGLVVRL